MKQLLKIASLTMLLALVFGACQSNDKQSIRDEARESLSVPTNPTLPISTPAPAGGAVAGVQHYICPNNCAGSGGPSAGTCPTCGSAYEHNQAWHNQQASTNTPSTSISVPPPSPGSSPNISIPTTSSLNSGAAAGAGAGGATSGQNAAGVWHYTCSNGCAGGAGSAGPCGTCGETLVHNQAYHN